jgi:hypothetical protein
MTLESEAAASGVASPAKERTTRGFGGSRGKCIVSARTHLERLEHLSGRLRAAAPKPAKELLRPMAEEEQTNGRAEEEATYSHLMTIM